MIFLQDQKDQDLVRFYAFSKNQAKRSLKSATFNRSILLGIDREQESVALFTENIDHTKIIKQYFAHMNPRLRGYIGDTDTALVTTAQPLIPTEIHSPLDNLLQANHAEGELFILQFCH